MEFTKTLETKFGKVVIILGESEDLDHDTELRYWFRPEGFGTCSFALSFNEDTDDSYDKAIKAFKKADLEETENVIKNVVTLMTSE